MDQALSAAVEAGPTESEPGLGETMVFKECQSDLKWERDELSKSEGTNPSGSFSSRKIFFFFNILKTVKCEIL